MVSRHSLRARCPVENASTTSPAPATRPCDPGARPRWQVATTVVVLAALCALRRPELLAAPRFWAEEGTLFYRAALTDGLLPTLLRPPLGYQNLATTLSTTGAAVLPIDAAPTFTTWIAFAVQVLTASLAVTMAGRYVASFGASLLLAALVLALSPTEIWLTSTNLHYWLGVAAWFVLCDQRSDGARPRHGTRALLLLAGLSGVQACFLLPLFLLRAWSTRARERWIQSGILAAASLLQIVTIVASWLQVDPNLWTRFVAPDPSWLLLATYHTVEPLLGHEWLGSPPSAASVWLAFAATALLLLAVAVAQVRRGEQVTGWAAWLLVIALSTAGSLHFAGGLRYAFGPNVIAFTLLFAGCARGRPGWQRAVCALLVGAAVLSNGWHYRARIHWAPDLPVWTDEVRHWRQDRSFTPRIWPDGWVVQLPPQ